MTRDAWSDIVLRPALQELDADDDPTAWELFHENSKTSRYQRGLQPRAVVLRMQSMWESLPYDQYPEVELPQSRSPLELSLEEAILTRTSARRLAPVQLTLEQVATMLHCSYGVTRDNQGTLFPRPFRAVPSAGALFPLELYFHSVSVEGLSGGLYHYNPARGNLRRLHEGDLRDEVASSLVQSEFAHDASIVLLITALFERSAFKYGERGYRFTLLEAGHVAQNMTLVANGLGLGSVTIGGFYDRGLDDLLGLDGVTQSTLYLVAIGGQLESETAGGEGLG